MIDNIRSYLAGVPVSQRTNKLREYLQWLVLRSIDLRGFRKHVAFVGGAFSFREFTEGIENDMPRFGLTCSRGQCKDAKPVRSIFRRFLQANSAHCFFAPISRAAIITT